MRRRQTSQHQGTRIWRSAAILMATVALIGWSTGCKEQGKLPRKPIAMPSSPQALQGKRPRIMRSTRSLRSKASQSGNRVAGIAWRVPKGWTLGRKRRMRAATYWIPNASGQRGECSIFHFGPQGGSDQANIDRWRKQFRFPTATAAAANVKVTKKYVSGIKLTLISIKGTFLWSPRPMSPNTVPRANYRMLGAIVKAPAGPVFFKCVGPQTVMANAEKKFRGMMFSIRKGS